MDQRKEIEILYAFYSYYKYVPCNFILLVILLGKMKNYKY